jgi:hypothetical protein
MMEREHGEDHEDEGDKRLRRAADYDGKIKAARCGVRSAVVTLCLHLGQHGTFQSPTVRFEREKRQTSTLITALIEA